ncbi:MAG: DUF411 domain-containing protein [Xanthobacteraceae bacterium]
MLNRRQAIAITLAMTAYNSRAGADQKIQATLFKNPDCGCCEGYADYLRENGFEVKTVATHELSLIKKQYEVPEILAGCHTTLIDKYVVEGHVPVNPIKKLLSERPGIKGISLPGMPDGSPGMTGQKTEPFTIYEIDDPPRVYAQE